MSDTLQEAWRARQQPAEEGWGYVIVGNPSFTPGWSIEQCVEDLLARAEVVMTDRRCTNVNPWQWLRDLEYLRRRKITEATV